MSELSVAQIAYYLNQSPQSLGVEPELRALRPQFQVHVVDQVASTNRALWDLLEAGAGSGTVVIAHQQTAGRGQRGRVWRSPPGGLYLSLALEPDLPTTTQTQLTLCVAWGVAQALRNLGLPVGIKWLNDLVIDGRKLGGILTETRLQQAMITQAVIGLGLNWRNPVPDTGITLAKGLTLGTDPGAISTLSQVAAIALRGMIQGYYGWRQWGDDWLQQAYADLCVNLYQTVEIDGQVGTITGVTASGDLNVQFPANTLNSKSAEIRISPGTVSLGYR